MPVNSFENYYMSWKPEKAKLKKPLYKSISEALEYDIVNGNIAPKTKLPPQRELADFLDVNLSTITKVYKTCQLKGLLYGVTGKGTFVSPNVNTKNKLFERSVGCNYIEMGFIKSDFNLNIKSIEKIGNLLSKETMVDLFETKSYDINEKQLLSAKKWFCKLNLEVSIDNILITSGAQNAMAIILTSMFKAGDKIATDPYTYPNFIQLANYLNIQLIPVKNDDCGMIPQELELACRLHNIKGVFLMPSFSNPTNITMNMKRRVMIADIITKNRLILIEDDVYAFLLPKNYFPISKMVPEASIYISGLSKAFFPSLRVAFIYFSDKFRRDILSGFRSINVTNSVLDTELVRRLIESGLYSELVNEKKNIMELRNEIYKEYFKCEEINSYQYSFFKWLKLPDKLKSDYVEQKAKEKGVSIMSSNKFSICNIEESEYVRLAICSPKDNYELKKALNIIKDILE